MDAQLPTDRAHAFLDDYRATPLAVELVLRIRAGKSESASVLVDPETPEGVIAAQVNQHMGRAAVLANIDQRLLNDPHDFECGPRPADDFVHVGRKARVDTGLGPETFHRPGNLAEESITNRESCAHF